jgi:hypothetical protein
MTVLDCRTPGEAADKKIANFNSTLDCPGPVLARKKLFLIHPGLKAGFSQGGVKPFDFRTIFFRVRKEYPDAAVRLKNDSLLIQLKRT